MTPVKVFILEDKNSKELSYGPVPSMQNKSRTIVSPPICKGMTSLDRSAFDKEIQVPTVTLQGEQIFQVYQILKPYYLKAAKFNPVQECSEKNTKKIYLNPDMLSELNLEEFFEDLKLKSSNSSVFKSIHLETVSFTFDNWTYDQIFDAILPDDQEKVSGFSRMGHLVHLNLKDNLLPYKTVIGQVLLETLPNVKTIVNKINIIDNTYRNFQMEVLAGVLDTVVKVKESKCEFEFDFAKVYWNPRLATEHERIVKVLNKGDTLYDVFAGVGPFSLPAGKKQVRVLANDLNPESFKWLVHNAKKNKVVHQVQTFNQDGRDFIMNVIKKDLEEQINLNQTQNHVFHITMNLPAMAVDFLSAFWGLLENSTISDLKIIVHVYCFVKSAQDFKEEAISLVKEKLDFDLQPSHIQQILHVRKVGPNKEMFRISFHLPHELLTTQRKDLFSVTAADKVYAIAEDSKHTLHVPVLQAISVLEQALDEYGPDRICICFTGGKDCTALLHLFYAVILKKMPKYEAEMKALRVKIDEPFTENEAFINDSVKRYKLNLWSYNGCIQLGLRSALAEHPEIQAVLMGTRRTDPSGQNLTPFQMTDPSWPQVMRVSPLLDWSYSDVWQFLRSLAIPYCSLYDQGYTSIGSRSNTLPNPALLMTHEEGKEGQYRPAYELNNSATERSGRQ